MHIKAYLSHKTQKKNLLNYESDRTATGNNKKSAFFQIPFIQDRMFTDGSWFHRPGIMPHVENHRPIIKRRIIRMRQQLGNSATNLKNKTIRQSKTQIMRNAYTPIVKNKVNWKKQETLQPYPTGQNKFLTVKETIVRQMSEVPDYARNIMKPCKIQAMTISHRPSTSRKTSTGQRSWRGKQSERSSIHKKQSIVDKLLMNKNFLNGLCTSQNNIQPWDQIEDQFANY